MHSIWPSTLTVLATGDLPALVAARLFADLGARVSVLVPPGGHPLATVPPFIGGVGAAWWELTRDMTPVVAPTDEPDVLFDARPPGAPELPVGVSAITARITPFGMTGPCADWQGGDLIVSAASGLLDLVGDPDRAPLRIGGGPVASLAGAQAASAAAIALFERSRSGQGQFIDISAQASAAWATHPIRPLWLLERQMTKRSGPSRPFGEASRRLIFPCADGYVAMQGVLGREWAAFIAWAGETGMDEPLRDPRFARVAEVAGTVPGGVDQVVVDEVDRLIIPFLLRHNKRTLYEEGQRRRIIVFPVNGPADLLADDQLNTRQFFKRAVAPDGRTFDVPGDPVRVNFGPDGQHPHPLPVSGGGALAGLRVLDFSWVGAGPMTTLQLALHGAEVIRVESNLRPDILRLSPPYVGGQRDLETSGYFAPLNAAKTGISLNLTVEAGREVARRLAARCDLVVESFTPRVMEQWGLDYLTLSKDNPGLIMLSMSMLGGSGPGRDALGFGTVLQAAAGFAALTGWPDRDPVATGIPFTDWLAPFCVLPTLLAALDHRRRTGQGCYLDCSQLEATLALFREPIVATQLGSFAKRTGNRLLFGGEEIAFPHGVYRAKGDDRWIAIACYDDRHWEALTRVIPKAPVAPTCCLSERLTARKTIETWLAAWTTDCDADVLAEMLQQAGVPAAAVRDAQTASDDAQLRHRGFGTVIDHPVAGPTPYDPPAYSLHRTPARLARAPLLGEATEPIVRRLLDLSAAEFEELAETGAFL
ncbi:MAG: CoA transferase [Dehalococcoidia bacterium]